jgi:integrase
LTWSAASVSGTDAEAMSDQTQADFRSRRGIPCRQEAQVRCGGRQTGATLARCYAAHVECWLREFAATFPGHRLGDLNRDFLARYMAAHAALGPSRATTAAPRWRCFCAGASGKTISPTHRLLEADAMQKEQLDTAATDFYRPANFAALLESAEGPMRAIIALQGLAGLRLEEALRLTWENVFGIPGHIEITAQNAKTRRRRLVEICPALAAWLEPFRGMEGKSGTKPPT